ncbi:hypothetical protein [Trichothermofontia sp.]
MMQPPSTLNLLGQCLRAGCVLVLLGLLCLLTACGTGVPGLSQAVVRNAIALQLSLAQEELSQQLHLDAPAPQSFTVKHVQIKRVEPTTIANTGAYHVTGSYDLKLKGAGRSLTQPSQFEVYLQPQPENETWRLARLQGGTRQQAPTWGTYLIPMD